ncbi:MAG: IS630 family transposase [Planctomycetes bacterium]|nr:IS630 family transposase [Planctomycetota bacterium]
MQSGVYTVWMRKCQISNSDDIILALQDEIRRSDESRYDHRLHALLLVAQGMSAREASMILGDAPRTVALWVERFELEGLSGLIDEDRPGRPKRLTEEQIEDLQEIVRKDPAQNNILSAVWDGKTLSAFIRQRWGIEIGARQCQRMFRQWGFRLRKPRPQIARADPDRQEKFKKNFKILE